MSDDDVDGSNVLSRNTFSQFRRLSIKKEFSRKLIRNAILGPDLVSESQFFVFFSFVNIFEKDKEHKTIFTELHVVARDFFVRTPRHTVGTDVSTGV